MNTWPEDASTVINEITGSNLTAFQVGTVQGDLNIDASTHVHNYGSDGPAFWVLEHLDVPAPGLDELSRLREQPSKLLTARRQAIAFAGRDRVMADVRQWLDDPELPSGAWLIHAPGGQGKTRLAAEMASQAKAASWTVGHARHRNEGGVPVDPLTAAEVRGPLLLVVDYAERWPQLDLRRLLHEWVPGRREPLRLLLLARSTEWWPQLEDECDKLDVDTRELALPPLAGDEAGRRELFDQACRRYADIYGLGEVSFTPPGRLSDRTYDQTLALHMAALAVVDAEARQERPPRRPDDLSRYLLSRERGYWDKTYGVAGGSAARRTVFTAALTGPVSNRTGSAVLDRIGLPAAEATTAQKLLDAHARCYPPTDPGMVLEPMYPDRLAEDFIALTLPGHTTANTVDTWATALIGHPATMFPDGRDAGRALMFLAAAGARWPHMTSHLRKLLVADPALAVRAGGAALIAVTPHTDVQLAMAISRHLPHRDFELDVAAVRLVEHIVALTPESTTDRAVRASLLLDLSHRYANTGQHARALAPGERAAELYRELANEDPAAHLSYLAGALNDLSNRLSRLGRRDEGLALIEEAVAVARRLVETDQVRWQPLLATCAGNLGTALSKLGRRQESLAPTEEAASVHRRLVERDRVRWLPGFARSVHDLGATAAELGQYERALSHTEAAVELRRELAAASPTAHLPDLAASLDNLSCWLWLLGRRQEATAPSSEALDIRRRLAEINPDAYLPDLATSLNNGGSTLAKMGQREQALAYTQQAVDIRRRLAETYPRTYARDLASALNNLGARLLELGRTQQALAATEEAVVIIRRLAETNPAAHLPLYATSLHNLSQLHANLGQGKEGLAAAEEAVTIGRRLAAQDPETYLPDLATSLSMLGHLQAGSGSPDEADATSEEAIAILRNLARANPAAHLRDLAASLTNLSSSLLRRGHKESALTASEEAVKIFRDLTAIADEAFAALLASALNNHGVVLSALGRHDDALTASNEAVNCSGKLAEDDPDAHALDHANNLSGYAFVRAACGSELSLALMAANAAAEIYHRWGRHSPATYGPALIRAGATIAHLLDRLGRGEEAAALRRQLEEELGPPR